MKKFRRVGHSVCLGEKDWPPMIRDHAATEFNIQLVVDALNYYVENSPEWKKKLEEYQKRGK